MATRIVALVLLAWEPLNFASRLLPLWRTLAYRGWVPAIELAIHGAVALLCAAAGVALWNQANGARTLATLAILASAARALVTLWWTSLPSQMKPGDAPLHAVVVLLAAAGTLFILRRPAR